MAMLTPAEQHQIERLRAFRAGRAGREAALGEVVNSLAVQFKKQRRRFGGAAEAWRAVLPRPLFEQTSIVGLRAGVLTVRVADAGARFQIDSLLRIGAQRSLTRISDGAIQRVRLVL